MLFSIWINYWKQNKLLPTQLFNMVLQKTNKHKNKIKTKQNKNKTNTKENPNCKYIIFVSWEELHKWLYCNFNIRNYNLAEHIMTGTAE